MSFINPTTVNIATSAAAALAKSIPKSQLARIGLTKAPVAGLLPVAGAVAATAAITALAIPQSRKWLLDKGKAWYGALQSEQPPADGELRDAAQEKAAA